MRLGKGKKFFAMLLSIVLLALLATPIAQAAEEYDYPNKYLWYLPTDSFTWDTYYSLYDHHKGMGVAGFDAEAMVNSPLGESMVKDVFNFLTYTDEMHPAVVQSFADKGIKKELFNADNPDHKYAIYTPLSASKPENANKQYPVLFVYHGNNNPIYFVETWGYAQMVAEEEFICVIPWATNGTTLDTDMEEIWGNLQENYRMDESRVYATGFSLGGRSTVLQATRTPNRFAAVGVGGQHMAGSNSANSPIPDAQWAAMKDVPVLQMAGTMDRNNHFPYAKSAMYTTSLNNWFTLNGIDRSFTQAQCKTISTTSTNLVERKLGLTADQTYIQQFDGTQYYTGDYYNDDGINMMRIVAIEGLPHWLSGSFSRIMWDFMSQYSKDPVTGKMAVLKQETSAYAVQTGETITLPVTVDDCRKFSGLTGTVEYDESLLTLDSIAAKKGFTMSQSGNKFTVVTPNGAGLDGDVVVGYATFTAKADLYDDVNTLISFTTGSAYDEALTSIMPRITPIRLAITSPVAIGDVSLDGKVDVADAIALMQYLAGSKTLTARQLRAADVNKDGKVNVGDVTIIMQMCL